MLAPADGRRFLVVMTEKGRAVIDETMTEHAENLKRLVASLSRQELEALDLAPRTLLRGLS